MLLLHAITTPVDAEVRDGFRSRPLVRLAFQDLAVWATSLPHDPEPFTKADVLDAHRVVSQIFEGVSACLPVRFPTVFVDSESLLLRVWAHPQASARQLDKVRDACELAVTAAWSPPIHESLEPVTQPVVDPVSETSPGRRYLLERQVAVAVSERLHARATQLADHIEGALGPLLLDSTRLPCPSQRVALSMALLVKRDHVQAAQNHLPPAQPDVRILVGGPWPPYSFAGVRSELAAHG